MKNLVAIEGVSGIANYEVVGVRVKVVSEEDVTEVKKGLFKQDYCIADTSGCCKNVTWEENVGILLVGDCYKLSGLVVRTYNGKKYLSVPTEGFHATKVEDIGVVENVPEEPATEVKFTRRCLRGVAELYNNNNKEF